MAALQHIPLAPELSRAAKRRRLGRIVSWPAENRGQSALVLPRHRRLPDGGVRLDARRWSQLGAENRSGDVNPLMDLSSATQHLIGKYALTPDFGPLFSVTPVTGWATTALRFAPLGFHAITLPEVPEGRYRLTRAERTPNQRRLHKLRSRIFALLQIQAVGIDR